MPGVGGVMDCREVERQIVSGDELSAEAQAHLLECEKCQEFSLLCLIAERRLDGPSAESDAKCRALMSNVESQSSLFFARGRLFASIAAALLVICGVMTILAVKQGNLAEEPVAVASLKPAAENLKLDWLLLADSNLENLELSKEDEKEPMKQLYAEIASIEMDFYDLF